MLQDQVPYYKPVLIPFRPVSLISTDGRSSTHSIQMSVYRTVRNTTFVLMTKGTRSGSVGSLDSASTRSYVLCGMLQQPKRNEGKCQRSPSWHACAYDINFWVAPAGSGFILRYIVIDLSRHKVGRMNFRLPLLDHTPTVPFRERWKFGIGVYEVVCAMRNVAADTLLLQQLCGMSQLLSD